MKLDLNDKNYNKKQKPNEEFRSAFKQFLDRKEKKEELPKNVVLYKNPKRK